MIHDLQRQGVRMKSEYIFGSRASLYPCTSKSSGILDWLPVRNVKLTASAVDTTTRGRGVDVAPIRTQVRSYLTFWQALALDTGQPVALMKLARSRRSRLLNQRNTRILSSDNP